MLHGQAAYIMQILIIPKNVKPKKTKTKKTSN